MTPPTINEDYDPEFPGIRAAMVLARLYIAARNALFWAGVIK